MSRAERLRKVEAEARVTKLPGGGWGVRLGELRVYGSTRDAAVCAAVSRLGLEKACVDCGGTPATERVIPEGSDGGFGLPESKRVICKRCAEELGLA